MISTMRQLEAPVPVERPGGLTTAAAKLRVAQPAISRSIAQIEERPALRRFERTTRALHATSACRDTVPIAERIFADARGLDGRAWLPNQRQSKHLISVSIKPAEASFLHNTQLESVAEDAA